MKGISGSITALRRGTSIGFMVLGYKGREGVIMKSISKHAKGAFSIPHSPTTSNSDAEMSILPLRYLTVLLLIFLTSLLFFSTHIQTGDLQIQSYAYHRIRNRNHPRAISSSKFTSLKENPSSTINVLRRSRTRTRSDLNLNLSGNIGIGVCLFNYWYYYIPPLLPPPFSFSLSSFLLFSFSYPGFG